MSDYVIDVTRDTTAVFRTASGNTLDVKASVGPAGQIELSVDGGQGPCAVWVMTDLVLGGEEDAGY